MSAGRHTSGPWLTHCSHIYAPDGAIIAVVHNPGSKASDYPLEANRDLMAASPLYAAATQPVVDNLVGQDDTPDDDFIPVRAGDLRALNEAHLKAIGQ